MQTMGVRYWWVRRTLQCMDGQALRARRQEADVSQEHLAYAMGTTVSRLRLIERTEMVDSAVARRYENGLAVLLGLRRAAGRRIARAAREAAAV